MKNSLLLRTLLLASALATSPTQAADPQPAPAMPDLARLMAMLNQLAAETELAPADEEPAPAVHEPVAPPPAARRSAPPLRGASLTVSGPLGGRGPAASAPANGSHWRALFPLK